MTARSDVGKGKDDPPVPAERAAPSEDLARLALDLGQARDLHALYQRLCAFVAKRTPLSGMFVSSYDPAVGLRTCVYAFSDGEELDPAIFPPMPDTGSPHALAIRAGETIITRDFARAMAGKPRFNVGLERDPRLPQSSVVVPMSAHGRILGAMEIQSHDPDAFKDSDVATLKMAATLAALAVGNVHALQREKALRRELERRASDLEAKVLDRVRELASKNRELEAFSFTVAHDLRAPLRAILNLSQVLVSDHGKSMPADARQDLEAILASSLKMSQLVDDLLRFAQTTQAALRRQLVDMSGIAGAILSDLSATAPQREIDAKVEDNLIAEGDPALLRVLLDNLISNAWKYSTKKPRTSIHVGSFIEDDELVFYVRDEGSGFDPTQATRLFQAFSRLHNPNEYEGTGVGLATAERIVRRHGGRIWATSAPGEGATFFFTLAPRRGDAGVTVPR